jgi:hypothetical protein
MQWNVASLPTGTVRFVIGSANSGWYATPAKEQNRTIQFQYYILERYGRQEWDTQTHYSVPVILL